MLKYIKSYAASISGIDIYPMISLTIFFLFFVCMLYYVKRMDKGFVSDMDQMPLEGGEVANTNAQL